MIFRTEKTQCIKIENVDLREQPAVLQYVKQYELII